MVTRQYGHRAGPPHKRTQSQSGRNSSTSTAELMGYKVNFLRIIHYHVLLEQKHRFWCQCSVLSCKSAPLPLAINLKQESGGVNIKVLKAFPLFIFISQGTHCIIINVIINSKILPISKYGCFKY